MVGLLILSRFHWELDQMQSLSRSSLCSSASLEASHVLLAMGVPHEKAHGSLRLSISHETTDEDIDYIIDTVPGIVKRLREMSPLWEEVVKENK